MQQAPAWLAVNKKDVWSNTSIVRRMQQMMS
jgi:hypothetical protein